MASGFRTHNLDLQFRLWKVLHPGSSFSDFYAGSIVAKLGRGGTHKTLVSKRPASGSPQTAEWGTAAQRSRDLAYFRLAKQQGLRPQHTCVDFGCGSLRVGRYLIDYLDPQHYWGLDVVSDFYEAGMTRFPAGTLELKEPRLHVLDLRAILAARQAAPDFVFSFAVLKHVPPDELESYFANITALMTSRTKAVISFSEAGKTSRTGSKIWEHSIDDLATSVARQGAGLVCTANSRRPNATLPRKSVLTISRIGT